jgi:hypothetical protein
MTPDEVGSQAPAAVGGKSPRKPDNSWDSDGFSTNRDDFDLFGSENRKDSSYLDYSLTHANGETRGADELVGAGVGRSEASVGAQGSYERAGAFGGSDPSRVSHGADGFGSTADFGATAGHTGHGAHGVSNSADVGGGVGDALRGTHAAGAPTGQGGGHVGADTGTHGGSSAPAQGPHRADPGMPTGDTQGVSRADSAPGHGDTPRAGQGGDGAPDALTTPKKDTPVGDALGGDKQPHSGKHAAHTPTTHADEAADTTKAVHSSGDAHGSGKADADAKQGHDSVERADADPTTKDHSANGKANDAADSTRHGDKTEADKPGPDAPEKLPYNEIAEDLRGEPTRPAKTTPEDPQTVDDYAKVLDNNYEANRAATAAPDALEKSPNDDMIEELSGDTQPHGGKHAADTPATHVDEAADTTKAGHGSGDANGSGKVDADAKQGHDSVERADADPTTKDHSANDKADDAADSTRHGAKTEADKPEADKPTSDKSHKEDDTAHHDDAEHPKDTDDKHTTKTDDADTHKSDKDSDGKTTKDSGGHADADPKAKDHSANGKADDAADSTHHGDKTEADKPTSDKSHKEDDAAHHDGDEHPKDTDNKHTTKTDDADTKSTKDEADTHKSNKDADGTSDKDADGKSDKDADGSTRKHNGSTDGQGSGGGDGNGSGGGDGNGSGGGKRPLTVEEIESLPQAPNHKVATPEAVKAWVDACIEQIPDLSHEELMAVYNYSGPQYKLINGWLRDPSMAVPADIPKTVETLNEFLDRLPPHNKAVFRGTKVPQHILDEAFRTGVYRDPAFFSTSTKAEVAERFMNRLKPEPGETRVLFEIEEASGSNVRPMSMYATQDEILFKSGVDFEVLDKTRHDNGSWTIKLRQRE